MRRKSFSLLGVLCSVVSVSGFWAQAAAQGATGSLTVDDLVARALTDNLELRALRAEVDAAQGRLQQAALRPNPMLELGAQDNVTGTDTNLMASVLLPLDLNGRKAGRVGVADRIADVPRAGNLHRSAP